jgi:7-cyano-7-deazaguanine synthase in queuosine biosynthesis
LRGWLDSSLNVTVQYHGEATESDLLLVPGRNLLTGAKALAEAVGTLTSLEEDLLTLAAAVYAADVALRRGEREQFTRDFRLQIPVTNYEAFVRHEAELIDILYFLTSDNWNVEFSARQETPEPHQGWPSGEGTTLLFSGGLDSFSAAIEELSSDRPLQLVSHYTANRVIRQSQESLHAHLCANFDPEPRRIAIRAGGRSRGSLHFPADHAREPTQRTRTLLFVVIAAIVARRTGFSNLLMVGENGQMAIHLPLTPARIGAFSTHTAHPEFLFDVQNYLSSLLHVQLIFTNPFVYKTKAETIDSVVGTRRHRKAIPQSVSCWGAGRHAFSHCGDCVPCIVRRIALEHRGVKLKEYARDLFIQDVISLNVDDSGRRNLLELAEFATIFSTCSDGVLEDKFPELINPHFDRKAAIAMYRRFAGEARTVFGRYGRLAPLLT